jgi:hypothetical protein
MNELFQIPESKSPRLRWMERNHLSVEMSIELVGDAKWSCFHGLKPIAFGATENDALTAAAKKLNIKLWNEE